MAKVIVFGASGFLGTHLIRKLSTDSEVTAIDILPPRAVLPNVQYIVSDVRDLTNLAITSDVHRIYNFAAIHTTPGHLTHEYYETNICGALEVTRFAERSGIPEIIFTSSISVYGPSEDMKTETSKPAPTSSYGYSKLFAEKIHRDWFNRGNGLRKLTIVRPAVVFGEGERGNFTRLARLLRTGWFIYPGRRDTIKACIYVDDLLRAIEFARNSPENVVLFNGAYPGRYTLEQIVDALKREAFPAAKSIMIPSVVVSGAAKLLKGLGGSRLGIHPERVAKLMRSTDIFPGWLENNHFNFQGELEWILKRWAQDTNRTFE